MHNVYTTRLPFALRDQFPIKHTTVFTDYNSTQICSHDHLHLIPRVGKFWSFPTTPPLPLMPSFLNTFSWVAKEVLRTLTSGFPLLQLMACYKTKRTLLDSQVIELALQVGLIKSRPYLLPSYTHTHTHTSTLEPLNMHALT